MRRDSQSRRWRRATAAAVAVSAATFCSTAAAQQSCTGLCCKRHPKACTTISTAGQYALPPPPPLPSSLDAVASRAEQVDSPPGWPTPPVITDDVSLQRVASAKCCGGNDVQRAARVDAIARMHSHGMVKMERRLRTVELALAALAVPGDYVECGSNTGGTAVLMLAVLRDFAPHGRILFAADSFQGLPSPTTEDAIDLTAHRHWRKGQHLARVSDFNKNLRRNGMYEGDGPKRVRVLEGWFSETLPKAPIHRISFLRLDGDLYVSTMDSLLHLYHKVIVGGMIYIDDYMAVGCRRALHEFRDRLNITTPMVKIWEQRNVVGVNGTSDNVTRLYEAVWWQKESATLA